ncbi:MAG: hypothetical protein IJO69_06135 [Ruminiclostridium sp.]|nr:hypothetical protein [Ruminiclostridium sp.]MBQ9933397.1 hypothetical protein [Ruminiclostridium sp.]
MNIKWDKVALFAGGLVVGTAGLKVLISKEAVKAYTHTTAAVLRVRECVMGTVSMVKETAEDILADAKQINEARAVEEEEIILDMSAEDAAEAE